MVVILAMLLLMHHEGCFLQATPCSAGVLTIGHGHTTTFGYPKVVHGMKISQPEAIILLYKDTKKVYDSIHQDVQHLDWFQQAALVSFTYNIGIEGFQKSTVRKRLFLRNNLYRDYSIALHLQRWNKINGKPAPGLTKRRREEAWILLWRLHVMELAVKVAICL